MNFIQLIAIQTSNASPADWIPRHSVNDLILAHVTSTINLAI